MKKIAASIKLFTWVTSEYRQQLLWRIKGLSAFESVRHIKSFMWIAKWVGLHEEWNEPFFSSEYIEVSHFFWLTNFHLFQNFFNVRNFKYSLDIIFSHWRGGFYHLVLLNLQTDMFVIHRSKILYIVLFECNQSVNSKRFFKNYICYYNKVKFNFKPN